VIENLVFSDTVSMPQEPFGITLTSSFFVTKMIIAPRLLLQPVESKVILSYQKRSRYFTFKIESLAHFGSVSSQADNLIDLRCQFLEDFVFFDIASIALIALIALVAPISLIVFRRNSLVDWSGTPVVDYRSIIKHPLYHHQQ